MTRPRRVPRSFLAATVLGLFGLLLAAGPAAAHPLGNFTINHYSGLRVSATAIEVDHVIDMAEIPAFQERRGAIDANGDGLISTDEEARYRVTACARQATALELSLGGIGLALAPVAAALGFPPGAGGLPTLRLTCEFRAVLPAPLDGPTELAFGDRSFADRIGWREIVVAGDGTTVGSSETLSASVSGRLTRYPTDLLAQPLAISVARAVVSPGGATLAPLELPELQPIAVGGAAAVGSGGPAVVGLGGPSAAVPGGVTELVPALATVLQAPEPAPPLVLLALLISAALGAYHAVTPGHGKTVMAAYLVGTRGGARQAVALALTVAVSHTLGVLGLALVVMAAQASLPPERLLPWLGFASGAVFMLIGAALVRDRVRDLRAERTHRRAHAYGHEHDHRHPDPSAALTGRGLFALGLSGGLVPAPSALLVFLGAIAVGRPGYGLLLVVAFGVGMAAVLAAIGLFVVVARGRLASWRSGARLRQLSGPFQLVAAGVVLAVGLAMTVQASTRLA